MANKLPWFTHDHNARNDEFIQRAEDEFGHFGYSAYFKILEIIHEHGTGGVLRMSKSRFCLNLRSRWPQTMEFLRFCIEHGKVEVRLKSGSSPAEPWLKLDSSRTSERGKFTSSSGEVELQNKKFIERQRKLKSNAPSMLHQRSSNAPLYREREGEEHNNLAQDKLAHPPDSVLEHKNGSKKTGPFHEFMDSFFLDYTDLKPGDQDPKEQAAVKAAYARFGKAGRDILAMAKGDPAVAKRGVDAVGERMNVSGLSWTLDTVCQHFLDWKSNPEEYKRATKNKR